MFSHMFVGKNAVCKTVEENLFMTQYLYRKGHMFLWEVSAFDSYNIYGCFCYFCLHGVIVFGHQERSTIIFRAVCIKENETEWIIEDEVTPQFRSTKKEQFSQPMYPKRKPEYLKIEKTIMKKLRKFHRRS